MMKAADRIIDLGPGAGEQGGQMIFSGTFTELLRSGSSLTGKYLKEELKIHAQWIDQIESQLDRPEKKVVAEISDVLEELTEDLKAATEKAEEQIKLLKETEKARSSRKR